MGTTPLLDLPPSPRSPPLTAPPPQSRLAKETLRPSKEMSSGLSVTLSLMWKRLRTVPRLSLATARAFVTPQKKSDTKLSIRTEEEELRRTQMAEIHSVFAWKGIHFLMLTKCSL